MRFHQPPYSPYYRNNLLQRPTNINPQQFVQPPNNILQIELDKTLDQKLDKILGRINAISTIIVKLNHIEKNIEELNKKLEKISKNQEEKELLA